MATLAAYLADAYDYSWKGGKDPAPACAAAIPRAELELRLSVLRKVEERSIVAHEHCKFLVRCLFLQGPPTPPPETVILLPPPASAAPEEPPPEPHHHHWWQR